MEEKKVKKNYVEVGEIRYVRGTRVAFLVSHTAPQRTLIIKYRVSISTSMFI